MTRYWLGKKRSPETIEKMRTAMKEKAKDPEFRKECGEKNKGKKSSKKGRTYEEIYGKEKAEKLRRKCRERQNRLWRNKDYRHHMSEAHEGQKGNWKGKKRPNMQGNKFAYKTGKTDRQGYTYLLMPKHPYANTKGYISEHRVVMEKHIGRRLKVSEEIHHIDNNRKNNDINNLVLFPSKSAHMKFHRKLKKDTW